MQFSSFIVFAIFAVSISRCAPALDAATLVDNAKQAQQLNTKFTTLKATDPCQGQESACLDGDIASCVNGKLDTSKGKCSESQQCFAIPDIRAPGTSLLCTSEITVIGLMNAAGVSGGITGADNVGSTSTTTSSSTSSTSTSTSTTSGRSRSSESPGAVTVTVTVTANSASTTTTTTVSPSEASSILSKFLTDGQPPATSTSSSSTSSSTGALTPAAQPSSTPPASPSGSSNSRLGTPSIVVTLTAGGDSSNPTPSPTTSSSGRVIQLTAAPDGANPSASTPTPSPPGVPVGGGGAGYGY